MSDQDDLEQKLSAARTRLIIDKPFLGALTLRLPLQAADASWCPTTATDARKFYYNPEYIEQLSLSQTQFILAHEALHCALSHFARRQHRSKQRWDIACDFAVNPLLVNDGLNPPPGALMEDGYQGMTAEEIYPFIEENSEQSTLDRHLYDSQEQGGQQGEDQQQPPQNEKDIAEQAQSTPPPGQSGKPQSGQQQSTQQRGPQQGQQAGTQPGQSGQQRGQQDRTQTPQPATVSQQPQSNQGSTESEPGAKAASPSQSPNISNHESSTTGSEQRGQGVPQPPPLSETEREELKVQWQQRLAGAAQQAQQAGKLGGAMARLVDHLLQPQLPWRSLLAHYVSNAARDDYSYARPNSRRGNPAIYPSLRSEEVDMVVALDTSGSISEQEMREFLSEVNAIKSQLRARIVFHACDSALASAGPWIFEAWENFELPPQIEGGGATDFTPVFDWVEQQDQTPRLLVYFTDAEGRFPDKMPAYEVIWLVKGKAPVPWGQRVQLN